jgi:TrmH family RNA methyltransferase
VRGSLGAIFSQQIVTATHAEFARWAERSGCMIVGTSPGGSADYREVDYTTRPVVLIMGSERTGISPEQAALCDQLVRIPMAGYVESLNLSIAAALVLYEVLRQHEAREAAIEPDV